MTDLRTSSESTIEKLRERLDEVEIAIISMMIMRMMIKMMMIKMIMITIGYNNDYIITGTKRVKIRIRFQASERSA